MAISKTVPEAKFDADRKNREVYEEPDVVQNYARYDALQPAEKRVRESLARSWSSMRVLDIGIGAGRTTAHLAPGCGEYIGVDYSAEMVKHCEQRFARLESSLRLEVADARDLSRFASGYFNLVIFSFNGIDYVSHEDRQIVLSEAARVLAPGGAFFFSSHNIRFLPQFLKFPFSFSLQKIKRKLARRRQVIAKNPDLRELAQRPFAYVYDGAHEFRLNTYYVDPCEQLRQLEAAGFARTETWSEEGRDTGIHRRDCKKDTWLNYLAYR